MHTFSLISAVVLAVAGSTAGHASIWHPSMYGFNVTDQTFPYDNRPVAPLTDMTFDQWWFHGHLDHPPNPGDIFNLPAGETVTTEIACNKGATTHFNSSEGGDIRDPNNPNDVCPGAPMAEYHTSGFDDLTGCALAIAYKNDAKDVKPEDFTVFSVNQTCVWTRFTDFEVPERMPPCPEGGCTCAWFWIHSPDSGGEQNYMNGFKCNITGSTSSVPLAKPEVPRRCGSDPSFNGSFNRVKLNTAPANCTYGAKQPFYWFQKEGNNMPEGTYSPPIYTDLYNFLDGAQDDIFEDSYEELPDPSPVAALPVLANIGNILSGSSADGTAGVGDGQVKSKSSSTPGVKGILGTLRANGIRIASAGNGSRTGNNRRMSLTRRSSATVTDVDVGRKANVNEKIPLPLLVKKEHRSPSSSGSIVQQREGVEEGWKRSRIARQSGEGEKPRYGVRMRW